MNSLLFPDQILSFDGKELNDDNMTGQEIGLFHNCVLSLISVQKALAEKRQHEQEEAEEEEEEERVIEQPQRRQEETMEDSRDEEIETKPTKLEYIKRPLPQEEPIQQHHHQPPQRATSPSLIVSQSNEPIPIRNNTNVQDRRNDLQAMSREFEAEIQRREKRSSLSNQRTGEFEQHHEPSSSSLRQSASTPTQLKPIIQSYKPNHPSSSSSIEYSFNYSKQAPTPTAPVTTPSNPQTNSRYVSPNRQHFHHSQPQQQHPQPQSKIQTSSSARTTSPSSSKSETTGQALLDEVLGGTYRTDYAFENAVRNLKEFGTEVGLADLEFDENFTCVVGVENRMNILITYDLNTERLYLYSTLLAFLPKDPATKLKLYEILLEGALLGRDMSGGGVGVSVKNELIVMSCSVDMFHSDSKGLLSVCGGFVDALDRWRTKIKDLLNNSGVQQQQPSSSSSFGRQGAASPQRSSLSSTMPTKSQQQQTKPRPASSNGHRSGSSSPEPEVIHQQQSGSLNKYQFKSNNSISSSNSNNNNVKSPRL